MRKAKEIVFIILLFILSTSLQAQISDTLKWVFKTSGLVSSVGLSNDMKILCTSFDKNIYVLDKDGILIWNYTLEESPHALTLNEEGTIYVCTNFYNIDYQKPNFFSIDKNGDLIWKKNLGADAYLSPAIGSNGTVYTGSWDYKVYAFYPNGESNWSYWCEGIRSAPSIGNDGKIYIGLADKFLHAINLDGTRKWKFETKFGTTSSAAISWDGIIYFGSDEGCLYALNSDGTQKWAFFSSINRNSRIKTSPVIGVDGTIYFSKYNLICAVNNDGTEKWCCEIKYLGDFSPIIGEDGTIFISNRSSLYAINPNGTIKWTYKIDSNFETDLTLSNDGTLYVGTISGLYAIESGCQGLAKSSWPKSNHDNKNTGNINTPLTSSDVKFNYFSANNNSFNQLFPNYPNPFNANTKIKYNLQNPGNVILKIYNISGQEIGTLVNEYQTMGEHEITWNPKGLSSGIYFFKLKSGEFLETKKLILQK